MAKVVPFRKPVKSKNSSDSVRRSSPEQRAQLGGFLSRVIDTVQISGLTVDEDSRIALLCMKIQLFISSLNGVVSPANIAERRNYVRETYTREEMLGFVHRSTEVDWKVRPAYYIALVQEIQKNTK